MPKDSHWNVCASMPKQGSQSSKSFQIVLIRQIFRIRKVRASEFGSFRNALACHLICAPTRRCRIFLAIVFYSLIISCRYAASICQFTRLWCVLEGTGIADDVVCIIVLWCASRCHASVSMIVMCFVWTFIQSEFITDDDHAHPAHFQELFLFAVPTGSPLGEPCWSFACACVV